MSDSQLPMWQRWAQFRFSVIGELLSCPPPKGELQKAISQLAQKSYRHPIDSNRLISFGPSTIERWYYKAKTASDPIAVLGRKIRSDAGVRWSMPEALLQALRVQYDNYPRWNVQLHYDNLKAMAKEQACLKDVPSYKTVLRCMRENGWLKTNAPAQPTNGQLRAEKRRQNREIRGFEVSHVHGLWHLHQTTLAYSPYHGKQETFWGQLESRLMELLRGIENLELPFVNQAAQAWVEQDYHRKYHREIKTTPLNRLFNGTDVSRSVPDSDALRLAFTRRITRRPRRSDATVVVDGIRYELPFRFAHLPSVILRAPGWDKSQMVLVDPDTDAPLARLLPQDKTKNASGKRRLIQPDRNTAAPVPSTDRPLPALLRKWMADYAATGLPPAYIPKEEIER
ncbi:putative integrase family protein [Desulfosarcina variabilis str. Montpellier]|uniref:IS481 family transposase n=1 Tax=Desulfosarcina variabilis TaxID=2300 RepID=UPI003AFB593C